MQISIQERAVGVAGKTVLALMLGSLSSVVLAWNAPTNLHEVDDALTWDSNATSHNIHRSLFSNALTESFRGKHLSVRHGRTD